MSYFVLNLFQPDGPAWQQFLYFNIEPERIGDSSLHEPCSRGVYLIFSNRPRPHSRVPAIFYSFPSDQLPSFVTGSRTPI